MTTEDWLALLCLMWVDFKNSLTIIQEFEFNQNKIVNKDIDCMPLGYKPKAALPGDVKVGKVEAKVGKDKKAPVKLLATPARDAVNICFGDLLNHYGHSLQGHSVQVHSLQGGHSVQVHSHDMTKQSILQRFQGVAQRLALTDATIALVTRKINADTKFK